jgi:hypothetical protein
MPSGLFNIIATFEDSEGNPLTGPEYSVRLYDKDLFFDDKLGKGILDADGNVSFLVSVADIKSIDSPDERTPDLYFVLEKKGQEIFRSQVFENVDFEIKNRVTGRTDQLTKSFGPFRIKKS